MDLKYKTTLAWCFLFIGIGSIFLLHPIGFFVGPLVAGLAGYYIMQMYSYEELEHKTTQGDALRTSMVANFTLRKQQ
ncbi:MAG: hypothetical protein ACFFDI_18260 [Promethearchaeota archaeon]